MFYVVFKLACVGFCCFVFDFNKIVIGKSTFLGYNDKKIFLYFFRFRVKLQHNLTFLVIYIQITQNGGYFMSTASIHSLSPLEDSTILIDLHTHSLSSGHGSNDTITDMAKAAAKSGIQILGISEHGPATAGSVKPSYFRSLKLANRKRFGITILYGAEVNIITPSGTLDLDDDVLSCLDYALVSIHPPTLTPYEHRDLTNAYINAMDHPNVRFLGHIDDARFPVDFERLLAIAKEKEVYPEINNGSLMPDAYRKGGQENCRKILEICKRINLPVLLSSDSHGAKNIGNIEYILPLLEECTFPEHLIINNQPELLWKILER